MLVESVSITKEGAVAGVIVVTVSNKEPVAGLVVVDAVTDLPEEAQVVVAVNVVWVDLGFPHRENLMSASLQLHADLSVYPKFWGYQVFIYSGYCSCHCRLPSKESTSGIPLI